MKKIIAITTVAFALLIASSANALTVAELQAQIASLTAQLAQLQAQLNQVSGGTTTTAACSGVTFSRNLKVGMSSNDVKCLQTTLNQSSDTQVSTTGAGSPGNETTYFGAKTYAAVTKFQEKYSADCLSPIGLTTGTGFVGTLTRTKLNAMLGTTGGGTVTPPVSIPGSGLTITLASDTPVAGTAVINQGLLNIAKLNFANGDSADAKVTTLKVKRIGVSSDTTLANIYLFDGATRLTDAASVSSGIVTFNDSTGLFTVGAKSAKTITIAADLAGLSGETVGVSLNAAADVTSTATAVNGAFPLNSNLQTLATATLATVGFNASTTPTSSNVDPQNDYTVWQNITTISTRAVNLTRISFRKIGSIKATDLQNFRLFVDGVQVGSAVQNLDANNYVTFDLSAVPKRLEAGSRIIKVLADIIGGSSLNFSLSLRVSSDANFVDTQYGVNVLPVVGSSTAFTERRSCSDGATPAVYACTINSGTITLQKMSDSPSGNIVNAATNATLGKFQIKAAGEKVKIETLTVQAIFTNVAAGAAADDCSIAVCADAAKFKLRNGMLLANGIQVGGTTSITSAAAGTPFSLGSSLIVEPGTPVTLEVKADIYDDTGANGNDIDATDTIAVRIIAGSSNSTGLVSLSSVNVPSAAKDGNTLTVKAGALTFAQYTAYTAQTPVTPLTAYKLAHFTLTADTTEAVNISSIEVDANGVLSSYSVATNMYVTYGTQTTNTKASVVGTNTWSINYTLNAGQAIDLAVYADVSSAVTTGSGIVSVLVTGTTVGSATTIYGPTAGTALAGQTIAFTSGSFAEAVSGDTPLDQAVAGNQTVTAAKFKFTASNDSATIQELYFTVANGTYPADAAILNAILKDGSTTLQTRNFDTTTSAANDTAKFTDLSVTVPANTSKVLTVDLLLAPISATASTSQRNVAITLDKCKWLSSSGAPTTDSSLAKAGNIMYVFKSLPTFEVQNLPSGQGVNLTAGSSTTLYVFKVSADVKGDIALKQLKFPVTVTDVGTQGTLKLSTFKFYRGSDDIGTSVTIRDGSDGNATDLESASNIQEGTTKVVVTFGATGNGEEVIPAGSSYTYSLKAAGSGFVSSSEGSDTVSTYLGGTADAATSVAKYFVRDHTTADGIYGLHTAQTGGESAYDVIWSDMSAVSHVVTNGSSSNDWSNGYLIKNLPLDSKGIVGGSSQ